MFALTVSNCVLNVSTNGLLASVSYIQLTENSSPKHDPIETPLTVSSGEQYAAHELSVAFDAVTAYTF